MARLYNFETNSYEEVPEEHIREGVLSKKYAFTDKSEVPIIAPDGTRHMVPGIHAREAFQKGGSYGSTQDWERLGRKEEYGEESWENYLGATLTGAARGATLGLSDVALRELVGKDRMQAWREEFSGASIAGEIAGAALPAMFSGGGTAGVTAARLGAKGLAKKVLGATPASAVFKGGKYLEDAISASRVLSQGANKGVALKILSSTLPKGVAGALEGAAFGAGTTFTETMLGDPEDVGELLLANVGYSALFGGLGNAGINAAMMGGAAGTKKLSQGMASLYEKTTGNKLSVAMQNKIAKTTATFMGKSDPERTALQTTVTPKAKAKRAEIHTKMGTFEDQTDGIVSEIDGVISDLDVVTTASRGKGKREAMRKIIFEGAETTPAAALAEVEKTLLNIIDPNGGAIDLAGITKATGMFRWLDEIPPGEVGDFAKRLQGILRGGEGNPAGVIQKWVSEASSSGPSTMRAVAEDAFLMLDDFKKFTADYVYGKHNQFIDVATATNLKTVWDNIHPLLEKASIWGNAATQQRVVNVAFNDLLPKMARFKSAFGYGKGTGWTSKKKVKKFLEKLDDDPQLKAVYNEFLASVGDFTNTSKAAYKFTDANVLAATDRLPKRAISANGRVEKLSKEMDEARFMFGTTGLNAFTEPVASELLLNLGRRSIGGLAGGMVAGGPGAAAGILLGGIADGAATARQLAAIEFAASRAKKALEKSLDDIVERMAKGGPDGAIPARPNRTKLFLAPLAAQFGEELSKEMTSKQDDYRTAKQRATNLADPQAITGVVNKVTEPLSQMPELSESLQNKMSNGIAYAIQGFKKDNRTTADLAMGVPEREPSDHEIAKMEIRLSILEDPITSFLGSIENRTCSRTHSVAMQKLWPKLYAMCQAGYYERVSELENGVPFIDRQVATIAFNQPHDVSYKPENINRLQSSYGEKSEEGGKIKSTPLLKTHFGKGPTEVEKVMA